MELWEQLLAGAIALFVLFIFFPGVKATMEKSKNAEEKTLGNTGAFSYRTRRLYHADDLFNTIDQYNSSI